MAQHNLKMVAPLRSADKWAAGQDERHTDLLSDRNVAKAARARRFENGKRYEARSREIWGTR